MTVEQARRRKGKEIEERIRRWIEKKKRRTEDYPPRIFCLSGGTKQRDCGQKVVSMGEKMPATGMPPLQLHGHVPNSPEYVSNVPNIALHGAKKKK